MVATWKEDTVDELASNIKSNKVVAVVSIKGIPSKQLQNMRSKLKPDVKLKVTRSTLLAKALESSKIKGLAEHLDGPCGLIFTDLNPFKLEKLLYESKSNAPAKPGNVAPFDLVAQEGDTGLPAGPLIGDLQSAGIKAKIQGGKIHVTERSVVVKAGDKVSQEAATALTRLGVEPMEIVLRILAAYEDGTVYGADILHIDDVKTRSELNNAYRSSFNLAFNAGIFTADTTELLITDAVCKARNLMINAEIVNSETVGIYLEKADAHAKSLKSALPADLLEGAKENPEKKVEDSTQATEEEKVEKADEPSKDESKAEKKEESKPDEPDKKEEAEESPKDESKAEKKEESKAE
jgi:large subunit ribosomal protein L10